MADEPTSMRTRPIDRAKLMKLAGGDAQLSRYLESLGLDLAGPVNDNIALLVRLVQSAQTLAEDAQARADAANLGLFDVTPIAPNVRPGSLILVAQDGAGYVVSVDEGQLLASIQTMLPTPIEQRPVNDAQSILAAQTFA